MSWSNRYLGIPWTCADDGRAGTHCWGLVRLVYAEQLGIDVGDYGPAPERAEVAALMKRDLTRSPWETLPAAAAPRPYDLIVIERAGIDDHVGVAVNGRLMLHLPAGSGGVSIVTAIDDPRWSRRIASLHRHRAVT